MNTIFIIAASFCIGQLFPEFFFRQIMYIKRLYGLRRLKPFDCEACLSYWAAFNISLWATGTGVLYSILTGIITFYISQRYAIHQYNNR